MTIDELIAELANVREAFEFRLTPHMGAAPERRARPRLRLRGVSKTGADGLLFEPIGAVCFARMGHAYGEDYWVEAAASIGLPLHDARDVIAAANDLTWRTVNDQRAPDPYKEMLRTRLILAAGLA